MTNSLPLRGPSVVCAHVLLDDNGRALPPLRDRKFGLSEAGLWVFPGGHAEPSETILDCVRREFLEETEYAVKEPRWLMSVSDAFLRKPAVSLEIFWDRYVPGRPFVCREGQSLNFIDRDPASSIQMPDYLAAIWDLAILAMRAEGKA